MALRRPGLEPKLAEYLGEVFVASRRASELVNQILTFSRQSEQRKVPLKVQPILKESLRLMRSALPADIAIRMDLQDVESMVQGDPTQLHQVFMNLAANAFQAMGGRGGVLSVTLRSEHLQEEGGLPEGDYLRLSFSDTGVGMDPSTLEQAFLPFFTTRRVGEGTGLGLSIVHGIIMGMGGRIMADSEPGHGSTFTVHLPLHEMAETVPVEPLPQAVEGRARVLLVDDDPSVGSLLADALALQGYRVTFQVSPARALRFLQEDPLGYDLLLTDMTMPEMSGLTLAAMAWEIRPSLPVVLVTGYAEKMGEKAILEKGFAALIRKPVPIAVLGSTLRDVLQRANSDMNV
jgi:CheY-like chemotaxis protein